MNYQTTHMRHSTILSEIARVSEIARRPPTISPRLFPTTHHRGHATLLRPRSDRRLSFARSHAHTRTQPRACAHRKRTMRF